MHSNRSKWIPFLAFFASSTYLLSGSGHDVLNIHFHHDHAHYRYEPIFGGNNYTMVTTTGHSVMLRCRYKHLNDKQISWIRMKDWHILTSNSFLYISDKRFKLVRNRQRYEWALEIANVTMSDNGTYQCQVAVGENMLSTFIHLYVKQPEVRIIGAREYTVLPGEPINITCFITQAVHPVQISWFSNNRTLYSSPPSLIITTKRHVGNKHLAALDSHLMMPTVVNASSSLVLPAITRAYTGVVTCRSSDSLSDSVHLFVGTKADKAAAISRRGQSGSTRRKPSVFLSLASLILLLPGVHHFYKLTVQIY